MANVIDIISDESVNNVKKAKFLEFILHGDKHKVCTDGLKPETSLNEYLRGNLHLTGTKFMCLEGGCGACVVVVRVRNSRTNILETYAVNSCLVSILSCSGWEITTIESLGNRKDGYHAIQERMVQFNGTQCGFCTPGMVMNMYALMETGKTKMAEIENSFGGQICRCTGYRPILTACKSLASDRDDSLLGTIPDIEELKICRKQDCEKTCTKPCLKIPETPIFYDLNQHVDDEDILEAVDASKRVWYKVSTIKEIFSVVNARENSNKSYRFVAGNTARGVYRDMEKADYYIDIFNVAELCGYTLSTQKLTLGANCTISETMTIFRDIAQRDDGFKYLLKLVEHLDLVATVPIRNIGTLAGNLCIKYQHREFPSDIFLLLETVNAIIVIDSGDYTQALKPYDFLHVNLTKKIIRQIEFPPLGSDYRLESYKIMPRAQNSHAYVNAGFLFSLTKTNTVKTANIVFGGINPNFVHAVKAERYICGKQLINNTNINMFLKTLASELNPDHVLPDASPEYRKQLAVALAYKYVLSLAPEDILSKEIRSGGKKLLRSEVSTGVQEYTTNKSMYPVGKPIHKLEAYDQVSGAAKYTVDLPDAPHQLYAVFVTCPYPAGSTLTKLDASKALEVKGVEAFYKAEDIPGVNSFMAPMHPLFYSVNEILFVPIGEKIKFYDQTVGLLVAKTLKIATDAVALVEVVCDPAETTPLLTIPDVINHNATDRIHHVTTLLPSNVDIGNLTEENGTVTDSFQINGTFNMGPQYHYSMEMQVVQVIPTDDGCLHIQPSTQNIDANQSAVAYLLNIPANKVEILVKRVGGAFGSKLTRSNLTVCGAALAAYKLNRPVKMRLTMEENMSLVGKRNTVYGTYSVTTDSRGKIINLDQKIYTGTGAYQNSVPVSFTTDPFMAIYMNKGFEVEYNYVLTDTPASTFARAPGSLEGSALLENVIEHIAYQLQMDPLDARLANLDEVRNPTLKKMFDEFPQWSGYRERRAAIGQFNKENRWRKKGLGIVAFGFPLGFLVNHGSQVSIYHSDGTVAVSHGGVEIGQGVNTKAAQVVAYELGIPIENVSIKATNNVMVPNNFGTGGSLTSESICRSLKVACTNLKQRINEAKEKSNLPDDTPWPKLVANAHNLGQTLCENNMWVADPPGSNNYIVYGIGLTEVEVDILTGQHIVQRVDLMEDTGDSSNPYIDIGQVEGAFIMGMGYWTTEQLVYDYDGRMLTNRSWNYKPPGAKDIPVDFRVKFPTGQPNMVAPYHNKATSEPPTCLSFSVALAIKDALRSARAQGDPKADQWIPIDGPFTIESTFMNSCHDLSQYRLQ